MGLYAAAQAKANGGAANQPPSASTANYYTNHTNSYVPPPSQAPPVAVAPPATPVSPPPKAKGGLGGLFGKKVEPVQTEPPVGANSSVGNSREWFHAILQRLQSTVASNKLEHFYRPEEVYKIALRIWNTVNVEQLSRRWNIPKELALDLIALALYDIVLFGDDSGSMRSENGARIDDLTFIVKKVTDVAVLFDDDGISVRFINTAVQLDNCKSENQIVELFSKVEYMYGTQLGTRMQTRILRPFVLDPAAAGKLKKPVLIITITDGEPTQEDPNAIFTVITAAKRALIRTKYGGGAVAFQFAQVGTDLGAQAFLKNLDDHPEVGDLVDCTSAFELEQEECLRKGVDLLPEMWLVKLMCGAIDPNYDGQD